MSATLASITPRRFTSGQRLAEYTSAHTPVPSDSDPGMTAQMTGAQPEDDRRVLRRRVQPRPAGARKRRRVAARRRAPTSSTTRRMTSTRPGSTPVRAIRAAGQHPEHDGHPAGRCSTWRRRSRSIRRRASRSTPLLPQGQHDLQRRPRCRAVDRVVRQAPRLGVLQRALRQRDHRHVRPRDRFHHAQARRDPLPESDLLDGRQRGDDAVRLLQGPGRAQLDRRLQPQPHPEGGRRRDLRDELPNRLHRRQAPNLGRPGRRPPIPPAPR